MTAFSDITLNDSVSAIRKLIDAEVETEKQIENINVQFNSIEGVNSINDSVLYIDQANQITKDIETIAFYENIGSVSSEEAIVIFSIRFKYSDGFYSKDDLIKILGITNAFDGEVIFDLNDDLVTAGSFNMSLDEAINKLTTNFIDNINDYEYLYRNNYEKEINRLKKISQTLQSNDVKANFNISNNGEVIIKQSSETVERLAELTEEEEHVEEPIVKPVENKTNIWFVVLMIVGICLILCTLLLIFVKPSIDVIVKSNT